MTSPALYALVLLESEDLPSADLPRIVRDHTQTPHRLFVFLDKAEAQTEYDHFSESFPESRYQVVQYSPEVP